MSEVLGLARPELADLRPYESARSLVERDASLVYLDANEAPSGRWTDGGLNRYPEPQPRALVERFSRLYDVPAESLLVGRGSDEAIDLLVRAFCRAGQDAILICPPTYGVYEIAARIQGAAVVRVPLRREGDTFAIDEPALSRALEWVKVIFLCSPNNPTGTAFEPAALSRICELAAGRAIVVVDEAYVEFSDQESMTRSLTRSPHLVVLRTMSKAWALAGARCGVALGSKEVIRLLHKIRAPYPLSTPAVNAVLAATTPAGGEELATRVHEARAERERVAALLRELGAEVFASATNFLLASFRRSAAVMASARRLGIIVRDRGQEIDGGIRVTIGTRAENDAFLRAVREIEP